MARTAAVLEAGDSREAILEAALAAFASKGFDGATTREIAARAGVNHGLIPYYFGGKPKLWRAAVDRAFARLMAGLDAVVDAPGLPSEEERVRVLIRGFVRFVADHPEFVLLMHEEGKRRGERMRWLVDRHVKPMFERMTLLICRAQAEGSLLPELDPVHFHYIVAGAIGVFFHQAEECRRLTGVDPFDDAVVEEHARAVEILLLGDAPEPATTEAERPE